MFKSILVLAAVLFSINVSQAADSGNRIKCEVIKVLNAESGFQVGNKMQFTTELDQVFMDGYSVNCEILSSQNDQVYQDTVQCEDSNLMLFTKKRTQLFIEDLAVLKCE